MENLKNSKKDIPEIKNTTKEMKMPLIDSLVDWTWLRKKISESKDSQ